MGSNSKAHGAERKTLGAINRRFTQTNADGDSPQRRRGRRELPIFGCQKITTTKTCSIADNTRDKGKSCKDSAVGGSR